MNTIAWLAVISWMGVIFYLSHQQASVSSELSAGLTKQVMEFLQSILPVVMEENQFHFFIRKGAHFFAYFILGIFAVNAFDKSGLKFRYALLTCVLYAISDEIHQLFIPGRSGEVRDVLIDSVGAFVGIITYVFLRHLLSRRTRFR